MFCIVFFNLPLHLAIWLPSILIYSPNWDFYQSSPNIPEPPKAIFYHLFFNSSMWNWQILGCWLRTEKYLSQVFCNSVKSVYELYIILILKRLPNIKLKFWKKLSRNKLVIAITVYCIWLSRNKLIFEDYQFSVIEVISKIKFLMYRQAHLLHLF